MASVMILGPRLTAVFEPFPVPIPAPSGTIGRRQLSFRDPATLPGGIVQLQLLPPVNEGDVVPINAYAFFVQPASSVPDDSIVTPDWFFKSGAHSGSIHLGAADAEGKLDIVVPGVQPSLDPYYVQIVLEFKS